jgi:hypothetical protein
VNNQTRLFNLLILLFCYFSATGIATAEPYKLGVEEKNYIEGNGYPSYPAPQMVPNPQQPMRAGVNNNSLQGGASNFAPPARTRPPLTATVQRVVLPPAFLGAWLVQGERTKVEAMPEFQQGAEKAFALNNSQVWNISGSPSGGYSLGSNTGVETALIVDKVQGTTAFIRYRHPVGNTMAQEAIVMKLLPGGAQFQGLERISIVKQDLPQPRAKVTYQLMGQRQR